MGLLFRLPFMLFELLLKRLLGRDDDPYVPAPAPTVSDVAPVSPGGGATFTGAPSANGAPTAPPAPPPPTADEAIARTAAREAEAVAAPDPEPPTPLRPIAGDGGHIETAAEFVESFGPADDVGDVGGTITVEAPWPSYDRDSATAITTRLKDADAATRAVVALYERSHKNRKTVLRAAG